jgi:hypothetical protein
MMSILSDILDLQFQLSEQKGHEASLKTMIAFNDAAASLSYRFSTMPAEGYPGVCSLERLNIVRLTTYICTSAIFPVLFGGPPMPVLLSIQLAQAILHSTAVDPTAWHQHTDILLWALFIGATFARPTPLHPAYLGYLRGLLAQLGELTATWQTTRRILEGFIWEERVFGKPCEALWEEARSGVYVSLGQSSEAKL